MKSSPGKITKIKAILEAGRPIGGLAAAFFFLNILMNVSYPSPEIGLRRLLWVSPEIVIVLNFVCLWASLRLPFHKALFIPLTLTVLLLRLFRFADNLVPMYFNRPFNLYLDSQFLPDLIFLLYSTLPLWIFILGCCAAAGVIAMIVWAIWRALKTIYTFFSGRCRRRLFSAAAVAIGVMIYLQNPWAAGYSRSVFAPGFLQRVAAEIDFILHLSAIKERHLAAFEEAIQKGAQYQKPLTKLKGSDVCVFFIESYGHTLFKDPRHTPLIIPFLRDAERKLQEHGYVIGSMFLRSPVFGGASGLAHGSLASGVPITSQLRYELLLTSQVQDMAEYFNRAGYLTVSVMPGTLWPWPGGEFYKYRKKYYAFDFDYRGPKFGWAPMPDQYVIDCIYRAEIQRRRQPLYIEFILVSSHAPFNRQPLYISDWSAIGDGSIYRTQKPLEFPVVWPDLENAAEAYATSVAYDFKVLTEFLTHMIDSDALIIILGDHQPNQKITGSNQPWSVPVHVISRNPNFIKPFIQRGYTPGLIPSQAPPHAGIESILWDLLEEFS
jgi:hypothetical protein